jgi:hypothetical protein
MRREEPSMLDRPDAATLLSAMAETLTREVLPATQETAQHSARVVANLCRILERELRAESVGTERSRTALSELLDQPGDLEELARVLDRRLGADQDDDPEFDARARKILLENVRRRLAIDRPGYDT